MFHVEQACRETPSSARGSGPSHEPGRSTWNTYGCWSSEDSGCLTEDLGYGRSTWNRRGSDHELHARIPPEGDEGRFICMKEAWVLKQQGVSAPALNFREHCSTWNNRSRDRDLLTCSGASRCGTFHVEQRCMDSDRQMRAVTPLIGSGRPSFEVPGPPVRQPYGFGKSAQPRCPESVSHE